MKSEKRKTKNEKRKTETEKRKTKIKPTSPCCYLVTDKTNLSSKLSVASRASQYWTWQLSSYDDHLALALRSLRFRSASQTLVRRITMQLIKTFLFSKWNEPAWLMRLWYLSYRRPAKAQASLRIRAVSPEPSLFAQLKYWNRRRVQPQIRHLAPLDGCTCAFEEWDYGERKVS